MLSRSSSLSLLALLSCISAIVAGPIHGSGFLHKRAQTLIGYRYVSADKAAEYTKYGTLTGIPASGVQLGEGAYISPDLNQWSVDDDYWLCRISADEDKFNAVKKMYIPDNWNPDLFWNQGSANRDAFLRTANMDPKSTLLFSKIDGLNYVQMLIPPYYLAKSPGFRGAYGSGDLGITISSTDHPVGEQDAIYDGNARWGSVWMIPGWGCDMFTRRDATAQSCPTPSPEGPIEIPSSMIPAPSGDVSTVSSYSFTEPEITATSAVLPSGMSYFPSGYSSALPTPVSGLLTAPIISASSSESASSFPQHISSSSSGSSGSPSSSGSTSAVSSASGQSSAAASSSSPASSTQSGVITSSLSSVQSSAASGSSSAASSSQSNAASLSSHASLAQSSAVTSSSSPASSAHWQSSTVFSSASSASSAQSSRAASSSVRISSAKSSAAASSVSLAKSSTAASSYTHPTSSAARSSSKASPSKSLSTVRSSAVAKSSTAKSTAIHTTSIKPVPTTTRKPSKPSRPTHRH